MREWTSATELRAKVLREWQRQRLLAGEVTFPWRLPLKGPGSAEALAARYDEVRQWIRALVDGARAEGSPGYRLEFREINHRQLGRNEIPVAAWCDTETDALALIGKRREAARWRELAAAITAAFPTLQDWCRRRPLAILEQADDWPKLLAILRWIADHPRPGVYLRQIDVPGVHSKFIEGRRGLLAELLDLILPADAIDPTTARGAGAFERRYGFRAKPECVRFRLLGGQDALQGLSDLSIPGEQFARLHLPVRRVFITENEINFLALPPVADALAIFGAGYGFDALARAQWLHERELWYWGDIDSHGFAILDQLRSHFPHARSMLMDRGTLMAHESLWGEEATPTRRDLVRLDTDEAALYDDLRYDRIGKALRLEQERIGFEWVVAALGRIVGPRS